MFGLSRLLNLKHLLGATLHSFSGLRIAWHNEQAFRHEVLVLGVLAFLLVWTEKTLIQSVMAMGVWLLVMTVELLNSAIEKTCDLVTLEQHPLIKAAKDMASAAIMLMMVLSVGVWAVIFLG